MHIPSAYRKVRHFRAHAPHKLTVALPAHCRLLGFLFLSLPLAVPVCSPGRVSTYKLIAASIGHPKAVRAVGTALSLNPFAPHVPCHRVIASDGRMGGFNGRTGQMDSEVQRKVDMLRAEGVMVDAAGRVVGAGCVVSVGVAGGVDVAETQNGWLAAAL